MVAEIEGVLYEFEVLKGAPPVALANQLMVLPAVADKETMPLPQRCPAIPVGSTGIRFTIALTTTLVLEQLAVSAAI